MLALRTLIAKFAVGNAQREITGLALSRFADISNACCRWENTKTQVRNLFGRQAIPMVWDFAEPSPLGGQAGDYAVTLETMIRVLDDLPRETSSAQIQQADACKSPLPDDAAQLWFIDPPYYDAIDYAHCSDFFFVWLKRILPGHQLLRDPYDATNPLTPKTQEIVVDSTTTKGHGTRTPDFYETAMSKAFGEGRRVLSDTGVGCVVFAHKTTEGWEALLSGMIRGGWVITGSWPIATESGTRLRARDSAALTTSVHLVCRPRTGNHVGDWGEVYRELPKRVGDWMERLQSEGVRGADLVFACIGPALEIYSRYAKVVDAEEREIPLGGNPEAIEPHKRGYLAYVWEAVGRAALEQVLGTAEARARNGAAGALEEDARLTALFLWALQSTDANGSAGFQPADEEESRQEAGATDDAEDDEEEAGQRPALRKKGLSLIFDVVRRFAQPLGIHLPDWEHRIIETDKGVVRLLPVGERAKQLFGEEGAESVADQIERNPKVTPQLSLFPDTPADRTRSIRGRGRSSRRTVPSGEALQTRREVTTLDRVHAAMLLQSAGRANALRELLKGEHERGPEFERLANALSALYPKGSEEKRLLDAMLLAVPR